MVIYGTMPKHDQLLHEMEEPLEPWPGSVTEESEYGHVELQTSLATLDAKTSDCG